MFTSVDQIQFSRLIGDRKEAAILGLPLTSESPLVTIYVDILPNESL